jgi:3-keto-L-gulonate-6-phosphate decarboxylase
LAGIDTIIVGQAIVSSRNPRDVARRVLAAWNEDSQWTR